MRLKALALGLALAAAPTLADADQLSAEEREGEAGYVAVEELSYETIIDASDGYTATLRLRVALNNSSRTTRDAVHNLALPFAAKIEKVSVMRDGAWTDGAPTKRTNTADRRNPGSVFVRELDPTTASDIPGVEIVAFGIEPGATLQVEVSARVYPRLRGDRWEFDLPARGRDATSLADHRRVLVKGLGAKENFFVDGDSNGNSPYISTLAVDTVTVAWPAHIKTRPGLDGHLEVLPGPAGFDDGLIRLYLNLGQGPAAKPDHVVVLVDHSLSTPKRLQAHTVKMLDSLFDALPPSTTFDVLAFNRRVTPLMDDFSGNAKVSDKRARKVAAAALASAERGQGTDLSEALAAGADRARKARARKGLVLVITDGMLPASLTPAEVSAAFAGAAARRRAPEVLFVIDDPMLERTGIRTTHPVARIAAGLGARISLKPLEKIATSAGSELLAAPRVLGGLDVVVPKNVQLIDNVPDGLVAGSFVLLRGQYTGKAPNAATIKGSFGTQSVGRTLKSVTVGQRPEALAATAAGDLADAVSEGYARPPWYSSLQRRTARQGITQAGRGGLEQRGFLDKKIFRHYLTIRVLPRARVCYNRALTHTGTQQGRIVLQMEVGKGEVMLADTVESSLKHNDPKLVACMTEAAWALDIPAAKMDDQIYRVRYPLRLIPPENGQPGSVVKIPDDVLQVLLSQPAPG